MYSRRTAIIGLICFYFFATGCGSKQKTAEKKDAPAAGAHQASAAKPSQPARSQSVDIWNEPLETPPPPPPAKDPDAAIAQYDSECANGDDSSKCHTLRLQVEQVFLNDLVAMRTTGQDIDRELYRVAAQAETPQLACIGLRELIYAKDRTSAEDAIIIAAAESPSRSVRGQVYTIAGSMPALTALWPRMKASAKGDSGTCWDDWQDTDPGLKWAGGYPNARFRYFASNASLRWFTTPDPVEKVLAYFNNSGRPARTEAELNAAEQGRFVEEANKITQANDPNAQAKLMELMQSIGHGAAWIAPVRDIEGAGEIRYVMIGKNQGIAIFKDDILHATSIVAPMPPQPVNMIPDVEKAKMEALVRSIYNF